MFNQTDLFALYEQNNIIAGNMKLGKTC